MKILMTPDILGWAIDNICNSIIRYNPQIKFFKIPVHPRNVEENLIQIINLLKKEKIDLWHAQYWYSAMQLIKIIPQLKEIPKILTHHNHYALEKEDWTIFDALIIQTKWGVEKLKQKHPNVFHIAHGIDLERFIYLLDDEYRGEKIGYIGRVIEHKNLHKICEVAEKLGYKVIGSGYIDKPKYWETISKKNLEFYGGIGRENMSNIYVKDEIYKQMKVFVMYSTEEKETGTLPLLEAMAKGIPILTTWQGSARDLINDGENGIIFNENNFKEKLKMLMEDEKLRKKLRKNARKTINNYSDKKVAREHEKLYYRILYPNQKIISVIIPTFDNYKSLLRTLLSIEINNYLAKEIIVCDDGENKMTWQIVNLCKQQFKTPIKYFNTNQNDYGLARARNIGAIESIGDILVFLDDRLSLEKDALEIISKNCLSETWNFGNKRVKKILSNKNNFVENFSWIYRKDFFRGGMFCERMNIYGGLSQEIRKRYSQQGYGFNFVPKAIAVENNSSCYNEKINEIWKAKFLLYKMYD